MADKYLMKGTEAIADAAHRNGCVHFFGYPITPPTEVSAYMSKVLPKIGGTFLQAESEIAAINMVPVSYTHLDVYKTQLLHNAKNTIVLVECGFLSN